MWHNDGANLVKRNEKQLRLQLALHKQLVDLASA